MKTTFLLLTSILLTLTTNAQNWQWIKGGGSSDNSYEYAIDIKTDSDRNIYVISKSGNNTIFIDGHEQINTGDATNQEMILTSFTCDGTYRWAKVFGGGGYDIIKSIAIDSQDNIYVAGSFGGGNNTRISNDWVMPYNDSHGDLYLVKFNQDGVFQWIQRPGDGNADVGSHEFFLINDIFYWFVGIKSGSYGNGAVVVPSTDEGYRKYLFKYDINGNFISGTPLNWENSGSAYTKYFHNPYNNKIYLKYEKGDNTTTVAVNGNTLSSFDFITCYDLNGNMEWIRESVSTGYGDVYITGLTFDPSNNIYVSGKIMGNLMTPNVSFLGYSLVSSEVYWGDYIIKTNPTADTLLWGTHTEQDYSGVGTPSLTSGLLYHNNKIAYTNACGYDNYHFDSNPNIFLDNNDSSGLEVFFAELDAQTGVTLRLDQMAISGDGCSNYGTAITTDLNGDYIIGGANCSFITDMYGNTTYSVGGSTDFFISKYATGACNALSVENPNYNSISLYPNPTKNSLYLSTPNNTVKSITIYSVLGQEIKLPITPAYQGSYINTTTLSKGTYFITIKTNTNEIKKKFIKE